MSSEVSASKTFHCTLTTPYGKILEEEVSFVSAPGFEGSLGVLAGHAPLITILKAGPVKIQKPSETLVYTIDAGILEVRAGDHAVLLLADTATKAGEPTTATKTSH